MIKLIVNADDLGSGPGRDRGIFRCFNEGIVTSASLLANGPSFVDAAKEAKALELPLGVHLNLSEGKALTGAVAGLTDGTGMFFGKQGLRERLLRGELDLYGVRRELTTQVERLREAGLNPDHLDTHQHFMLFPTMTELVLELAHALEIPAVRRPSPAESVEFDPLPPLGDELALYRRLAPAMDRKITTSGLFAPHGLWGMTCLGRLDCEALAELLRQMPPGTWELMVHPGFVDPGQPFSGPDREREMAALISPEIRRFTEESDLHLTSFRACLCAS